MISKRLETFLFLMTGGLISYMCRLDISIAAQGMRSDLNWTERQKGLVLSAFFWGYSLGQIPASLLSSKIGPKLCLGFSIVAPCVLTLLAPFASRHSFKGALIVRALIGLTAAGVYPSTYNFFPQWIPIQEKTVLITVAYSGMYLGEIIGYALAGVLMRESVDIHIGQAFSVHIEGWELIFYLFGLCGLVWLPIYWLRVHDTPSNHPAITVDELVLIKKGNPYYHHCEHMTACQQRDGGESSKLILTPQSRADGAVNLQNGRIDLEIDNHRCSYQSDAGGYNACHGCGYNVPTVDEGSVSYEETIGLLSGPGSIEVRERSETQMSLESDCHSRTPILVDQYATRSSIGDNDIELGQCASPAILQPLSSNFIGISQPPQTSLTLATAHLSYVTMDVKAGHGCEMSTSSQSAPSTRSTGTYRRLVTGSIKSHSDHSLAYGSSSCGRITSLTFPSSEQAISQSATILNSPISNGTIDANCLKTLEESGPVLSSNHVQSAGADHILLPLRSPVHTDHAGDNHEGRNKSIHAIIDIPWLVMLSHPVSLTLFVNHWTMGWIAFLVLTELPSYLTDDLGFSLANAGLLSVTPYVANFVSAILFSRVFDMLQNKNWMTVQSVRQWANRIAFAGASGCLLVCGHLPDPGIAFLFMVLCLFCFGAIQSGLSCVYLEVSPNYSGIMNTVGNMFSAFAGLTVPVVVASCVDTWGVRAGWKAIFNITAIMCFLSLIMWKLYQTSNVVHELNTPDMAIRRFCGGVASGGIGRGSIFTPGPIKNA